MWLYMATWIAVANGGVTVSLPETDQEVVFEDDIAGAVGEALVALADRRLDDAARQLDALAGAGGGADIRYLQALTRYEMGDLREAARVIESTLLVAPDHGPVLSLHGLVLRDLGKGETGLNTLGRARKEAEGDCALTSRIAINEGLIWADMGKQEVAERVLNEAAMTARGCGAAATARLAESELGRVRGKSEMSGDLVGRVAERLRAGQRKEALALLPASSGDDRRQKVRWYLASGMVFRSTGRLDQANVAFREGLHLARTGGLVRETAAILNELGVIHSLGGRFEVALDLVMEGIGLVAGSSLVLNEINYRVEAGKIALRLKDVSMARAQLERVELLVGGVEDDDAKGRIWELAGAVARQEGRVDDAGRQFSLALKHWTQRDGAGDAARIATSLVELYAGRDAKQAGRWKKEATRWFERSGNEWGSAHVFMAEGLGQSREGRLPEALKAFLSASEAAELAGGQRGKQLSNIARENAALALRALGHDESTVAQAEKLGLDEILHRHTQLTKAETLYETGRKHFDRREYAEAHAKFEKARSLFVALGEDGYVRMTTRALGWADWNMAIGVPLAKSRALYARVVQRAQSVQDVELEARGQAGLAMAKAELNEPDAVDALDHAGFLAQAAGLQALACKCWSGVVDRSTNLERRANAARRALDADASEGSVGAYAMYSVAVDAFNQGAFGLAEELAREVQPRGGELKQVIEHVLEEAVREQESLE